MKKESSRTNVVCAAVDKVVFDEIETRRKRLEMSRSEYVATLLAYSLFEEEELVAHV